MNKKELNIITATYKDMLYTNEVLEIDKSDSIREFKRLLDNLNLKDERYTVENEIICYKNNYNCIVRETFELIYNTFKKYNQYVNYNLDDIENIYNDLKYIMTVEDNKCHEARIRNILSYIK